MRSIRLRGSVVVIMVTCLVGASTLVARGGRDRPAKPKDVTLTGTITDLHSFMTEKPQPTRAVQRLIRGGMPAVLEIENGAVLLGGVSKQFRKELLRLVHEDVEIEGKLYEKRGLRYVDIIAMDIAGSGEDEHEDVDVEEEVDVEEAEVLEQVDLEPEPDQDDSQTPATEEPDPDAP